MKSILLQILTLDGLGYLKLVTAGNLPMWTTLKGKILEYTIVIIKIGL